MEDWKCREYYLVPLPCQSFHKFIQAVMGIPANWLLYKMPIVGLSNNCRLISCIALYKTQNTNQHASSSENELFDDEQIPLLKIWILLHKTNHQCHVRNMNSTAFFHRADNDNAIQTSFFIP